MSDVSGWQPEWDEYLAERGLKRRKPDAKAYNQAATVNHEHWARWIGRTDSVHADNSFQARAFVKATAFTRDTGEFPTSWASPVFDDPITAYVYAELHNWGQA